MTRLTITILVSMVLLTAAALLYSVVIQPQRSRIVCRQNLSQIGLAISHYHEGHGFYPPALSTQKPHHSWRVALLPWTGEQLLCEEYDQSVAWDVEPNLGLLNARPDFYACPEVVHGQRTSYQVPVSVRSAWPYDMSLRFRDITDGLSNTLFVIDAHHPEVPWTAPVDLTMQQALDTLAQGQSHSVGATHILMGDGSVKALSSDIEPDVRRALLSPAGGRAPSRRLSELAQAGFSREADLPASKGFGEVRAANRLKGVSLLPVANEPIVGSDSSLYCPTLALAWNRFAGSHSNSSSTKLATELAKIPFTDSDISADAVTIEVTRTSVACELRKHLAFPAKFDAFKLPLLFVDSEGEHPVRAFGVTSHWAEYATALSQIRIHDYRSSDDFIISIANESGEDLILAVIGQPPSIQSGVQQVFDRIRDSGLSSEAQSVVAGEQVVIPVLEVNAKAEFREQLVGSTGNPLETASQKVQFRLDERGALLWSEAAVVGENGHYDVQVGNRKFIFDRPFLVMLRESNQQHPYLAMWVGNSKLMIPNP